MAGDQVDQVMTPLFIQARADFFLFFSGVQGGGSWGGGGVVDVRKGGGALQQADVPWLAPRPGVPLIRQGWFGSIRNQRGVNEAFNNVVHSAQYDPGASRLVIYGHSAGAVNALELCRLFERHNTKAAADRRVTVDLLVTVDAAAQEQTDNIDRTVAACVKRNINFWQDEGFFASVLHWSRGGPNSGPCNPDNRQIKGTHDVDGTRLDTSHSTIDRITWADAKREMQAALNGQAS